MNVKAAKNEYWASCGKIVSEIICNVSGLHWSGFLQLSLSSKACKNALQLAHKGLIHASNIVSEGECSCTTQGQPFIVYVSLLCYILCMYLCSVKSTPVYDTSIWCPFCV